MTNLNIPNELISQLSKHITHVDKAVVSNTVALAEIHAEIMMDRQKRTLEGRETTSKELYKEMMSI